MWERQTTAGSDRELKYGRTLEWAGRILLFGGPVLAMGVLALVSVLFPSVQEEGSRVGLLLLALAPVAFGVSVFLAFRLLHRGKQHAARARAAGSEPDSRPPVLYLRSFTSDEMVGGLFRRMMLQTGVWPWFFSIEEQLAEAVLPVGPLVAIGRPGEALPTPGAVRQYVPDGAWQGVVRERLAQARLVILRAGTSAGLAWETAQAFTTVAPERLLVLVLNAKRGDYVAFARHLSEHVGVRLPDFRDVSRWRRASGFVELTGPAEARFVRLTAPWLRVGVFMPFRDRFGHSLRSTFLRLGIGWHPLPYSKYKLLVLGLIAAAAVLLAVGLATS